MSSHPRMRRSVSMFKSRPSTIDGVGESLSSGMSELSIVRYTSEYTLSPMRMPSLFVDALEETESGPAAIFLRGGKLQLTLSDKHSAGLDAMGQRDWAEMWRHWHFTAPRVCTHPQRRIERETRATTRSETPVLHWLLISHVNLLGLVKRSLAIKTSKVNASLYSQNFVRPLNPRNSWIVCVYLCYSLLNKF